MFSRFLLTSVFCLLPLISFAQIVTIRSGEHREFTRIVVPIPSGGSWDIEQNGQTISVTVPNFAGNFDTSRMFELIPRERIVAALADGNTLALTLGCDCGVAPFVTRDRFLVLDIATRDTALTAPYFEPLSMPEPSIMTEAVSKIEDTEDIPVTSVPPLTVARASKPKPPTVRLPLVTQRSGLSLSPHLKPADLPQRLRDSLSQTEQEALNAMQQRLAKELSAAATRGVLTPLPGRSIDAITSEGLSEKPEFQDPDQAINTVPNAARSVTNSIRVTSSIDMPILEKRVQEAVTRAGLTCPTNEEVNVSAWADDQPFHMQLGLAREMLYGEFDKLDRKGAVNLARIYIHFGFGAEALRILTLDPEVMRKEPMLKDLAHIMEFGTAPADSELKMLIDCETDVALWAILSQDTLDVAHSIDPSFALGALNRLPVNLRKFIAPALSQRLLSHGDTEAAATALRNIERLPSALPSAAKLAQANIAIDKGDLAEGSETLEEVINDNALQSPKALITLVETKLEANQPIDPETAGLIEAYAKELSGSDIGPALRRAHVLALIKSGQFDRGFSAIQEFNGNTEEEAAIALRQQVLKEVTATAGDVVFLEYLFEQSDRDLERLPNRSKLTLASRLVDLGFPEKASEIAVGMSKKPLNPDRQLLLAEIALRLEDPERALAELENAEGEKTDLLRARAELMAGAHREAANLFQRANQPDKALSAAWLADSLDLGILRDDPVFGPILALAESPIEATAEPDGMLERSDLALQESEAARQTLADFLAAPELNLNGATP